MKAKSGSGGQNHEIESVRYVSIARNDFWLCTVVSGFCLPDGGCDYAGFLVSAPGISTYSRDTITGAC